MAGTAADGRSSRASAPRGAPAEKLPAIDLEARASVLAGQHGTAQSEAQAVDGAGHLRTIAPLPSVTAVLMGSAGVSLIL